MSAVEDDMEWRRRPTKLATHIEEPDAHAQDEKERHRRHREKEKRRDESPGRARKAAQAAAAIAGGMGPMGAFGAGPGPGVKGHERAPGGVRPVKHAHPAKDPQTISILPITHVPLKAPAQSSSSAHPQAQPTKIMGFDRPSRATASASAQMSSLTTQLSENSQTSSMPPLSFSHTSVTSAASLSPEPRSRMSLASTDSAGTIKPNASSDKDRSRERERDARQEGSASDASGPNKPKIKGQIQSLAKMLSGLKTKH